jgi:hypothetical protein
MGNATVNSKNNLSALSLNVTLETANTPKNK